MTIYISGRISGLPLEEARTAFREVAEGLVRDGWDEVVNPFDNGLPPDAPWIKHLVRDLEILHDYEAIYMMRGWQESRGASIELSFALRTDKHIVYQ